jgi:hypothetical protein
MATSTYKTYLAQKASSGTTYTKVLDIKSFPDLGGSPELIETTTLSDAMQTNIKGVQSLDALEFTCNYSKTDYDAVKTLASEAEIHLAVMITEDGTNYNAFAWDGELDVFIAGGEVNAVIEMTVTSVSHTEISPLTSQYTESNGTFTVKS